MAPIPGLPCLTGLLYVRVWLASRTSSVARLGRGEERHVLCDRELSEVVANHLRLDFHLVEFLARVDADDASDHLGDDNHVPQVGLDEIWREQVRTKGPTVDSPRLGFWGITRLASRSASPPTWRGGAS